jgi:hypothetical protein
MWELAESDHPSLVKADRNGKPPASQSTHRMPLTHASKASFPSTTASLAFPRVLLVPRSPLGT